MKMFLLSDRLNIMKHGMFYIGDSFLNTIVLWIKVSKFAYTTCLEYLFQQLASINTTYSRLHFN